MNENKTAFSPQVLVSLDRQQVYNLLYYIYCVDCVVITEAHTAASAYQNS